MIFFNSQIFFFQNKREFVSFLLLISSLFLIGIYDDKYDLNPLKKLLLYAFFILICLLIDENLIIACKSNSIKILELQRQGKNKQTAKEFLLGKKISNNSILS